MKSLKSLMKKEKLKKQNATTTSIVNAFGGGTSSTPPPQTTPPPETSDPSGSLASTITSTVGKMMGKDEMNPMNPVTKPSLRQKFSKFLGLNNKPEAPVPSVSDSPVNPASLAGSTQSRQEAWDAMRRTGVKTPDQTVPHLQSKKDAGEKSRAGKLVIKSEEIMKQFKNLNKTELVKALKEITESIKELAEEQTKLIKSELAKGCGVKPKPSLGKEEIEAIEKRHDGMIPDGHEDKAVMIQHVGRLYRKGMIGDAMRMHRKYISRKKV